MLLPLTLASSLVTQIQTCGVVAHQPCRQLQQQLQQRLAAFLAQPLTPQAVLDFETDLRAFLDDCGRRFLETVFNQLEPAQPQDAPQQVTQEQLDYSRKESKSANRGGIGTLFGTIQLQRCLYEPLQEARDQGAHSFAPLEQQLGIVAANATPALAQRVGFWAQQHTQQEVRTLLQREHHVTWSIQVIRQVTAAVSQGIAAYVHAAMQQRLLGWLAEAQNHRGRRRFVLAVGRDGIMLPLRAADTYQEGSVATLSVYDGRGRRLGTLYLGMMPEPQQRQLSEQLTRLLQATLQAWTGPLPRLVYITDAGYHPTTYFSEVLQHLEDPQRPGSRLVWTRVVDYYHVCSYVSQLATVLFQQAAAGQAWARRMRQLLLEEDHGVFRVLHSAAHYHAQRTWTKAQAKTYREAYNYLRKYAPYLQYRQYRRQGLPIGSGVTEAGCKVVFTQRFKGSGMTWGAEGGAVILQLRVAVLSGIYDQVFGQWLADHEPVCLETHAVNLHETEDKAA